MKKRFAMFFTLLITGFTGLFASCGKSASITLTEITDAAETHTDLQAQYLQDDYKNILNYVKGEEELSRPKPVTLSWTPKNVTAESYQVAVSEKEDLSDPYIYTTSDTSLDVYNLKIKTTYYWNVSVASEEKTITSETSSFTTTSLPVRNLWVDGVTNFRDLGGWQIDDNHRVKQGLLYRCGRLNVSDSDTVELTVTEDGIDTLTNFLHMKTEIDLRTTDDNEVGSITSCPAGDSINYVSAPIEYVKPILSSNMDSWIEIFHTLGDESNYPIMYHCNIGTDRTGCMTFMVLGLLGVSLDDIYTDYAFSNFGAIESSRDYTRLTSSIDKITEGQEAETLSGKIYSYLTGKGVAAEDLDSMIRILTEEA